MHLMDDKKKLVSDDGRISLQKFDDQKTNINKDDILAFCCVRNEHLRLPYFIEYHRKLGVNRFFIIDNGSDDGTLDFLLADDQVHVFHTDASYADSRCGVDWLNLLLMKFGTDHWSLTLDADELFIYPECETKNLRTLVRYLESTGEQAMVTFMLDMYSSKPIKDSIAKPGQEFIEICDNFDADTYHLLDENGTPIRGGPRHRLFWHGKNQEKPSPVLKKIPFVKWRKDLSYQASTHILQNVQLSELTGALQHYKFFSDFYELAKEEVQRKEHWDGAAQYETYWSILEKNPNLTAFFSGSVKYTDSSQLVNLNLMNMPDKYQSFVYID